MYRAYFFGNYYLSGVQQGVQAIHVTSEMFKKYQYESKKNKHESENHVLKNWTCDGKTVILLNGGNSAALQTLCTVFNSKKNPFPWAFFNEDDASLNGALTSVGIILPECLAKANDEVKAELSAYASYLDTCKKEKKRPKFQLMDETKAVLETCPDVNYAYQLITMTQSCSLVK